LTARDQATLLNTSIETSNLASSLNRVHSIKISESDDCFYSYCGFIGCSYIASLD